MSDFAVVVPWVSEKQLENFLHAWGVEVLPDWLILQQDKEREGCGVMKNRGVARAVQQGVEVVVILDDDCFPVPECATLHLLARQHVDALKPQRVELFSAVTEPPSRGTPYVERTVELPVAASMGFWEEIGDYCAVRQLASDGMPMRYCPWPMYWRYFPLCGMNLAFKPREWMPWCSFIEVPRFDDIWMGWLWQHEAYRRGCCFNLAGPVVRHSRQSNVWNNLREEAKYLEQNEVLWREIAIHPSGDYESLRKLLPV